MFEYIRGEVAAKSPTYIVLDAGGVGYRMLISANSYEATPGVGQTTSLLIHFYVRDDQMKLFGFATREERGLFERLIAVSGVGPKAAVALLSGASPQRLLNAISEGDVAFLKAVKGIGEKTAKRILTELGADYSQLEAVILHRGPDAGPVADAVQALVQLGAAQPEAQRSVRQAMKRLGSDAAVEDLVREALRAP